MAFGAGMRVIVLIALTSLIANARCVTDCAFRCCSQPHQSTESQPPCHHKAPSSNHGGTERPCSHQILPGSDFRAAQPVTQTIPFGSVTTANAPVELLAESGVAAPYQSPPPALTVKGTAILRI